MSGTPFEEPTVGQILVYRKVAIAVTALFLGLPNAFARAVLDDEMDEYLQLRQPDRDRLKIMQRHVYNELLARECVVRYAATAAESLAADPESELAQCRIMGDTGLLGEADDWNVIDRVQEILEPIVPFGFTEDEGVILAETIRSLCNYYNSVAYRLVQGHLLTVILDAIEMIQRNGRLEVAWINSKLENLAEQDWNTLAPVSMMADGSDVYE